jgi:recombination protein RecR
MSSNIIQKLKECFERFPGIGPRQAQRFVYWLLNEEEEFIRDLSGLLLELKKDTKQCKQCFRFFSPPATGQAGEKCRLCDDLNRDNSRLLIVEKDADSENIEKAGVYNGRYFVLGDIIPFSQTPSKTIRLKELFGRAEKEAEKGLKEIILAFNAAAEGDNTVRYLEKILEPLAKKYSIKITRFGRGLSTGTELEYIDRDTLKNALENRK